MELPHFPGYRTLRELGRGGFGAVFIAEPEGRAALVEPGHEEGRPPLPPGHEGGRPGTAGARVAIKLAHRHPLDAEVRLLHEIAVLSDVGPPHVPTVLGSGRLPGGSPYVVMEHIDAPTLADRLVATPDPPPVAETLEIARAVLDALQAVHARGWAHLDLKPEHLFTVAHGARIIDFGLVTALDVTPTPSTRTEVAAGTAEYMAPEQCERHEAIDARADLYTMGVILYELLAGVPPFWGPPALVRESHLSRRPPRLSSVAPVPSNIPRRLEEIVHRCLAKDPRDRFASAAELAGALAAPADLPAPSRRGQPHVSASPPLPAADQRRTVSLLFFESTADVLAVQQRLASLGGQLAHASGGRYVAVHSVGDNPARSARRTARALLRHGICERVRIDVAPVSVQARPDGSKRFLSPIFKRRERFPSEADLPGISMTPAAEEVLSDADPPTSVGARSAPPSYRSGERSARRPAHAEPQAPAEPPAAAAPVEPSASTRVEPPIGRAAVLAALVESARVAARERTATVVQIIAGPGHGKSHLLRALRDRLRLLEPPADIIELSALEPELGGADQTVRELLLRTLDLPYAAPPDGDDRLREAFGRFGVAEAAPAVAVALGWAALGSELRTLEAAPGALRSALTAAAAAALRGRAAAKPVLILLDDAHQADEPALAALEVAALAEARVPLWICALARPRFAEERPTWGARAARREAYRLDPLDAQSAATLCRRLLLPVENVPELVVERLVARTQGIPLLLVELVRGMRREGLVRRRPQGDALYLATDELDRLPDLPLVEWQAQGELDALPEALKAHARLTALLGEEVSVTDTAGVLRRLEDDGGDADLPLDAGIAIAQLVTAGLLVEETGGRIAFRHGLVREAIAKDVPEPLRRRIHHAAAGHYLGAEPGPDRDRRLSQIAFHAAEAGLGSVAESAYLDLAERMRRRHAYVAAEGYYSRALEQPGAEDDPRRAGAYRGRGLMRYRIGRYHDALADFATARAAARRAGEVAAEIEILFDEATALDWMNDYRTSEERVREAQALMPRARSPLLEARLLLGVGRSRQRFSHQEEAADLFAAAAAAAGPLGDDGYETLVISLLMLGFVDQALGRLNEARAALDRVIVLCQEHGDKLHLGSAIYNRAQLWLLLGDPERMVADLERGLSLSRMLGNAALELQGEGNLAEFFYLLDELDAAEPHVRRAVEMERRRAGDAIRPDIALLEARIRYYRGDEPAARAAVAALRARQAESHALGETDVVMTPADEVLCDMIDLATRDAGAPEWDALEERSARSSVGQERIEVLEARGIAALRRGQPGEAVVRLELALAAAEQIPNAMGLRLRRRLSEATLRLSAGPPPGSLPS